jgi:ribosomal protein L22
MPAAKKGSAAKKTVAKKAGAKRASAPAKRARAQGPATEARALMRGTRQSPYKMRLVIDQIRGKDVNDALYIKHAVINEGPKLKRFMPAAQGRATPIQKRTSHVEIVVAERDGR